MSNLIVYKASAGSGKTFNLVIEYISLLLKDPTAYRHILAVTFTNNATTEMKQRIMSELYGLSISDQASDGYFKELLKRNPDLSETDIRLRSKWALDNILHDYSYFSIETIDSFFQRVLRNMSRELGIGSSYNLILDDSDIINEAIQRVIEETSDDDSLKKWYLDIIYQNIDEGKRWNIEESLKVFARNLSKEKFKEFEDKLSESLNRSVLDNYKKDLLDKKEKIKNTFLSFSESFDKILIDNGIDDSYFVQKGRGLPGFFKKLKDGNKFIDNILTSYCNNAENDANKWVKADSPLTTLVESTLMPLFAKAKLYWGENYKVYNTCNIALNHIDSLGLLNDIAKHRREILKQENSFLLSDTATLLAKMVDVDNVADVSFIYEKIGSYLKYIMIDEFQDTSQMNWKNFKLLLSESLDNQNRSIIVGDVKQSIYRWNNGDWGILSSIDKGITPEMEFNPRKPEIKALNVNYRTDKNIIDFNNDLFTQGLDVFCDRGKDTKLLDDNCIENIKNVFSDVKQEAQKEGGEVRCNFVLGNKKQEYSPLIQEKIISEIEYYQSKGYKANDIAILLRTNEQIRDVAAFLTDYKKQIVSNEFCYDVVSDDAFCYSSSKAINLIIDALRYIEDEKNTLSLCNIKLSIFSPDEVFIDNIKAIKQIPKELSWLSDREKLARKPLFDLVLYLSKKLELEKNHDDSSFLFSFIDSVQEYSKNSVSNITDFIKYWEEELSNKSITVSDSVDGIRLISIHKSKGLEFPVVIVPYANWGFVNSKTELWVDSHSDFDTIPIIPVSLSNLENSLMEGDYSEEVMQQYVDNLNILYVALTRPEHALSIICNLKKDKEERPKVDKITNVSEFIYSALMNKGLVSTNDDGDIFYINGESKPSKEKEKEETKNVFKIDGEKKEILVSWQDAEIKYAQTKQAEEYIKALVNDSLDNENQDKELTPRLKGVILHKLLSNIIIKEDVSKAIDTLLSSGDIREDNKQEFEGLINDMFSNPQIEEWFSGKYKVLNESAIIVKEDNTVSSKRPDRLMISGNKVIIVDYKFSSDEENMNRYKEQIDKYKGLMREMGYDDIEAYIWLITSGQIVKMD